jgi:hypothetical protein
MSDFLSTTAGRVARRAIAVIVAKQSRPNQRDWHNVLYHVGREPRSARAYAEAVSDFLSITNED